MKMRNYWTGGVGPGALMALSFWAMIISAPASVIELEAGRWNVEGALEADGVVVGADAVLGGGGTVNAPATVSGALAPDGTLSFNSTVTFLGGELRSHASDSSTLDGIAAVGAVTGTATVRMTRAETAFPTQQVVIAGSAASDYGLIAVFPTTNWSKGTGGALNMWVTYQNGTRVVLHDFYLQEVGGTVFACWRTASEEDTVGFDLYRWENGAWAKVNGALIPGSGEMGGSYCVADAGANAADVFAYKLVEIETDGGVREYGPFEVAASNPRLENLAATPEGVVLRWLGREGDVYGVQKAADVRSGFAPLATGLRATPPVNVYTDKTEIGRGAYYRVVVE